MTPEQNRQYQKEWRRKNKEKCKQSQKRYHDSHREQLKQYNDRTKEQKARAFRLRVYGLTDEAFKKLKQDQNDACAICFKIKPLQIDHYHKTKSIRGLLCRECNLGLGKFQDSLTYLRSAMWYLEKQQEVVYR
jgi:hypothetical protein